MSTLQSITPVGPVFGQMRPPGSKSITNRAFICAALADGVSNLTGVLDSDDTRVMIEALRQLGLRVDGDPKIGTWQVAGAGGKLPAASATLYVGNSGTTVRFLTAMVAVAHGTFRLDGVPRMRERPIRDLADSLNQLGAEVQCELGTGCPPVTVHARGLRGGETQIHGDISSQFLSGLLMAAPYADHDVTIRVVGELVSKPYVEMTARVMSAFGVEVKISSDVIHVPTQCHYRATDYSIEPDASAASYFWATAAITQGRVKVLGLTPDALQGDVEFCDCLAQMGCQVNVDNEGIEVQGGPLKGIDVNMNGISDTVQTLAAVALFAEGPTRIRDVGHIRHKETDRIGDLARELRKLGATVNEFDDGLEIIPGELHGASIATYDDHRMAMSLALPGLRIPGVVIQNPECTAKTYPRFFEDLAELVSGRTSS